MKLYISIFFLTTLTMYAQWNGVPNIPKTKPIPAIYYDGKTAIACADSVIYISDDNGNSWVQSTKIDSVDYINTAIIYGDRIFLGTEIYGVYESSDGGKTWKEFNNGFWGMGSNTIQKLELRGENLYAATMGSGIFVCNLNSSSTWLHFSNGLYSNYSYSIYSLKNISGNLFTGAGISAYYYINQNNSSYWNEYKIDGFNSMFFYEISDYEQNIYMAASLGLFKSVDAGKTFSLANHNIGAIYDASIAMNGSDIYLSFTKPLISFWFKSVDGGNTINFIEDQPGFEVLSSSIIGDKLYAGRRDGLWFRNLNTTSVDNEVISYDYTLYQNYPNPFNPGTTIKYFIPGVDRGGSSIYNVKLEIYDVLGRKITTLVNREQSPGVYEVPLNAQTLGLSSGVYFYRLSAGQFSETKKFVFLK